MHTGPERFERLLARTAAQLAGHTAVSLSEAESMLSGLAIEHEVSLRRHAPRLVALREMGRELDAMDVRWPGDVTVLTTTASTAAAFGITTLEAAAAFGRLAGRL